MSVQVFGLSDTGLVRDLNEDAIFYDQNQKGQLLAIVCDGIGGNEAGEVAARLAVSFFEEAFAVLPDLLYDYEVDRWLRLQINTLNDQIREHPTQALLKKSMGTTLAGVLITNGKTYIFNAGDSRIYALYPDGLILMSKDHVHSRTDHKLTSALGIWSLVRMEINRLKEGYSCLLICSDGLYQELSRSELEKVLLEKESLEVKTHQLLELANQAGGSDNCSLVLIEACQKQALESMENPCVS